MHSHPLTRFAALRATTRGGLRRAGFTLIELLIVLLIIAILASLLLVAVWRVRGKADDVAILNDISKLAVGLEQYRIDRGEYPPVTTDRDQDLIRAHLAKCYPRYTFAKLSAEDPVPMLSTLRPDQALVFWLGGMPISSDGTATGASRGLEGFSANPKDPFRSSSQGTWSARRNTQAVQRTKSYVDFEPSRLRPPPLAAAPQAFWVYVPPGGETPYVYFRAQDYGRSSDPNRPIRYTFTTNGVQHSAVPYREWPRNAADPADVSSSNRYVNGETFQILCAGEDGLFGEDARASAAYDFRIFPTGEGYSPQGYEEDNLGNFSTKRLGESRP